MTEWLLILGGFALLIGAAEFLVRGSVWCALSLGISPMTIGLTLVAFGTSAPELFVSLTAGLQGVPGIATGNALGSNVANIGLIVGTAALLRPIDHPPRSARFEVRFLLLVSTLILVPILLGELDRIGGILLLALLAMFTLQLLRRESRRRSDRKRAAADGDDVDSHIPSHIERGIGPAVIHIAFVIGGLLGLKFGGDFLVQGGTDVARRLGLSEFVIGQTIIAVGTSLPELATSAVAARRGHPEIALGNVLGSNIFNICMVLGATATIVPLPMERHDEGPTTLLGLLMVIALAILLRYRGGVGRAAGLVLLLTWSAYVATIVMLG
jgi:cation:H+ antiporter